MPTNEINRKRIENVT